jgi:hypothetical protein
MEYFEITKELLENANTFMPLETKTVASTDIANECIVELPVVEKSGGIPNLPLPPVYGESPEMKAMLLCSTLFTYYLNVEMPTPADKTNGEEGMDVYDIYNYYFGGHPLNQIERFKGDKDVKNIAFDLLEDWREFKKMVDTKIFNLKAQHNDTLARIWDSLAVLGTPENVEALAKEIEEAKTLGLKGEAQDGKEQS